MTPACTAISCVNPGTRSTGALKGAPGRAGGFLLVGLAGAEARLVVAHGWVAESPDLPGRIPVYWVSAPPKASRTGACPSASLQGPTPDGSSGRCRTRP